jgi:hypothetical protein
VDGEMLHLTSNSLYEKNRSFLYRLPLASRITIARVTGVIPRISLLSLSQVVPEVVAALIGELEMDIPSGIHVSWERASQCLAFHK